MSDNGKICLDVHDTFLTQSVAMAYYKLEMCNIARIAIIQAILVIRLVSFFAVHITKSGFLTSHLAY